MPKKLKIHPNERVDIPDFEWAANDYSAESIQFLKRQLVQAWKSYVLSGFEIALANQSTSPGEITVYNGHASDRTGRALNEESQVDDSRTITLSGASTPFYIEIEFTETDSDSDARAFWDPTHVNASGEEPGKEFSANVATRVTPSWRIVTPVSTSDFEVNSNPDSTRIPLAVLHTDSDNEITSSANPGLSTENGAFKSLTKDHSTGDTKIYVTDSKFFPDSGNATISKRDGSVDETVSITANDREHNIISISAGLTNDYEADSYFFSPDGVERVIRFNEDHSSAHPDQREILWRGDPVAGHSFFYSNSSLSSPSARGDNNVKNLKEYIDFLSAQLRELKWGHPRTDVISNAPPSDFSSTNYYSPTGGIQAARANTASVGDGSISYGDFNGTDEVPLQDAIDFFSTSTNDRGVVYLKRGTYTLANVLTVDKELEVIGEGIDNTIISLTAADQLVIDAGAIDDRLTSFKNISFVNTSGSSANIDVQRGRVKFDNCYFSDVTLEDTTSTAKELTLRDCNFVTSLGLGVSVVSLETLQNSRIENCMFDESGGGSADTAISDAGTWTNVHIDNCRFTGNLNRSLDFSNTQEELLITDSKVESEFSLSGSLTDTIIKNCKFRTGDISGAITRSVVENCVFNARGDAVALDLDNTIKTIDLDIIDCKFIDFSDKGISGDEKTGRIRVAGCYFVGDAGNVRGVSFGSSWHCDTTTVIDCEFVDIGTSGSTGVASIWLELSSDASDKVVKIHKNVINNVDGDSSVYGIVVGDAGTSGTTEVQISENAVYGIDAAGQSAGIYIGGSPTTEVQISNNKIRALESSANTLYGIYCNSIKNSVISSNVLKDLNNTETSSPDVKGIYVKDSTNVQVIGNTLIDFTLGAAPDVLDTSSYISSEGTLSSISLNDNLITYDSSDSHDPRAAIYIKFIGNSELVSVKGNSIRCTSSAVSSNPNSAVYVTADTNTDTISGLKISENTVIDYNSANGSSHIEASCIGVTAEEDCRNISIIANVLHSLFDKSTGALIASIMADSNSFDNIQISDNILDYDAASGGNSIRIRRNSKSVVSNNSINHSGDDPAIYLDESSRIVVTGNAVAYNGAGTNAIEVNGGNTYYVHGNQVTGGDINEYANLGSADDTTFWNHEV